MTNYDRSQSSTSGELVSQNVVTELRPVPVTSVAVSSDAYSFGEIYAALRHWWWQSTIGGVLAAILACGVVWLLFDPVYEAAAFLEIRDQPLYVAFEPRSSSSLFFKTQIQTLQSPVVLSKVSTQPEIASLPEARQADSVDEWLKKGLTVSYRGQSELCEVNFRAKDSGAAAQVVNAIIDAYLESDTTGAQTIRIIDLLGEQKAKREQEVKDLQEKVRRLAKDATGETPILVSPNQPLVMPPNPIRALQDRETEAEVDLTVLMARQRAIEESTGVVRAAMPGSKLYAEVEANPTIRGLNDEVARLKAQISEYEHVVSKPEKNPAVTSLKEQLTRAEDSLKKSRSKLQTAIEREWTEMTALSAKAEKEKILSDLKAEIDGKRLLKELWQKQINDERQKLESTSDASLALEFARSDLRRAEEVYQKVSDRIIALRTEQKAPARATVLKRAVSPTVPVEAVPYKKLGAAGLGAFCLPFGIALLIERRMRRIGDATQLKKGMGLAVLGEVASLPARALIPGLKSADQFDLERAMFEESVDGLRVALTHGPSFRHIQSLVVTSAVSGEGKTSLSYALAHSLARCTHEATLLIDADLRDPDLHELTGIAQSPGLAEVLAGEAEVSDAIVSEAGQDVHFLHAGNLKVNPHRLLSDQEFPALLAQLALKYRYVIIDAPPILAAGEAAAIAAAADGTLLCTMRDVSRAGQLQLAADKLTAAGAHLVGSVMSGVPAKVWAHKYGTYGYRWKEQEVESRARKVVRPRVPSGL